MLKEKETKQFVFHVYEFINEYINMYMNVHIYVSTNAYIDNEYKYHNLYQQATYHLQTREYILKSNSRVSRKHVFTLDIDGSIVPL